MWRGVSILFGFMLCTSATGQVYEWFGADGNRHFSDQKPQGVEYRVLGDPAANLSSYAPAAIRSPAPASGGDAADMASRSENRASGPAATRNELEVMCADYLAQIDAIHDRLRAGYDEPMGNRLRAKRSALRAAYQRDCN